MLIQKVKIDGTNFLYKRNGTEHLIIEGEDYAFNLTLDFEGTAYLYDKTTGITKAIRSGEVVKNGEYILSKTEAYGQFEKVSFIVNTSGPKVNVSNAVYTEPQTIIIEKPEIIREATLRKTDGTLISNDINVINGYVLNESGVNTYSLYLEDTKGRTTVLDSIIVYIAE